MVNSCAVCGCCTRTDIVREHLEDTLKICDVSAKGLYRGDSQLNTFNNHMLHVFIVQDFILQDLPDTHT
jgi:hypothetical protein